MTLKRTTKMAFQAALAIAIAELISMYFYVERGYWITLTAMVLTTQTWGESIKRSVERVGMTILGGIVGTSLYFFIPHNDSTLLLSLVLFFIFFTIYMAKIQHLISVFFLTCFVVFLFALIGDWSFLLLRARIIDTALGALIAVIVGCFFFSIKTNIDNLFIDYLQKIKAVMSTAFNVNYQPQTLITGHSLLADFQKIKKSALLIRYELLFHRLSSRDFNMLLNRVEFCAQYLINLIDAYYWLSPHLTREEGTIIAVAIKTTEHNISTIINQFKKNKEATLLPMTSLTELLSHAIAADPCRFATLESDALGFFNLIYFFTRLNTYLKDIYCIIGKAY